VTRGLFFPRGARSGADPSGAQFPAGKDNYGMPLARRCGEGSIGACK
jgi:hypothetical protein